jgi:tetratricopeptide (TPR) repeat protein
MKLSKKWMILSGILCGAAIGHKLTAAIPALVSLIMLLGWDIYHWIKGKRGFSKPSFCWIGGMIAAIFPWFLRSFLATGNPVYPYLSDFFGGNLVKSWHTAAQISTSIQSNGWNGLLDYFRYLLGTYSENGGLMPPNWGPTVFFGLLSLLSFKKDMSISLRFCTLIVIVSWLAHLIYSLEVRYHIGFLIYIIGMSFAFSYYKIKHLMFLRIIKNLIILVVALSFTQNMLHSKMLNIIQTSLVLFTSGLSPGNFDFIYSDEQANDMRWMSYLINTRADKDDGVLLAGVLYSYGIRRRLFFSNDRDKQIIHELAEKSSDVKELRENLRKLGVNHILFSSDFYTSYTSHARKELKIQEKDVQKIKELFDKHMNFRFVAQSGKMYWYSFENAIPIILDKNDAIEFPTVYINHAFSLYLKGETGSGQKMLEDIVSVPMHQLNRINALAALASIYNGKGDKHNAEQILKSAISLAPNLPQPYVNMALFHSNYGETEEMKDMIRKAIKLGGISLVKNNQELSKYIER